MTEETNNVAAEVTATTPEVVQEQVQTDWKASLPEDIKSSKSLEKFKDVGDIVKSYVNLESMIGKKVSEMPAEVVNQFLKVPSAPEKYILSEDADKLVNKALLEKGIAAKISQDQMKVLTDTMVELTRAEDAKLKADAEKALQLEQEKLKEKFGSALEDRLNQVKNIFRKYGSEDLLTKATESGIIHKAEFIEFFDRITQDALSVKMVESDFQKRAVTPDEARKLIEVKKADPAFMDRYLNRSNPGHKLAVDEMSELFSAAYSG